MVETVAAKAESQGGSDAAAVVQSAYNAFNTARTPPKHCLFEFVFIRSPSPHEAYTRFVDYLSEPNPVAAGGVPYLDKTSQTSCVEIPPQETPPAKRPPSRSCPLLVRPGRTGGRPGARGLSPQSQAFPPARQRVAAAGASPERVGAGPDLRHLRPALRPRLGRPAAQRPQAAEPSRPCRRVQTTPPATRRPAF